MLNGNKKNQFMLPFTEKHWPCNNVEFEGLFGQAAFYIHGVPSAPT